MKKVQYVIEGSRFVRLPAVLQFAGLRRTQLHEAIRRGEFPRAVKLTPGGRAIGWLEEELLAWRDARIAARDQEAKA